MTDVIRSGVVSQESGDGDSLDRTISELVLSLKQPTWNGVLPILDEYLPRLIMHVYGTVPAYRKIMDAVGLKPQDIKSWSDFDEKFPLINPETYFTMVAMFGEDTAFKPASSDLAWYFQNSMRSNVKMRNAHSMRSRRKNKPHIIARVHQEDLTASELGFSGALARSMEEKDFLFLAADRSDPFAAVLERAFVYSGFNLFNGNSQGFVSNVPSGIVLPPNIRQLPDGFEAIINSGNFHSVIGPSNFVSGIASPKLKVFHYSDLSMYAGLFPVHFGNRAIPFPNLMYAISPDSRRTNSSGVLVVNNLFGVSEKPFNPYSLLKRGIEGFIREVGVKNEQIGVLLKNRIPPDYHTLLEKELGKPLRDYSDLAQAYKIVVSKWAREALHWGFPTGTIFLKFAIPAVGQIDDEFRILQEERVLGTTNIENGTLYLPLNDNYPIRHLRTEFLLNIVAGTKRGSPKRARVYDITRGGHRDFFPKGREYFYTQPCILERDFRDALEWSNQKSRMDATIRASVEDIHSILAGLYDRMKSDGFFKEMFCRKSGLPVSEVNAMIAGIGDLISVRSLKKIAYASLVDYKANLENLVECELDRGMEAIRNSHPNSPIYMVTPSNTNPFDAFLILSHLLLAALSGRPLVYNVRTSESDLSMSRLLADFDEVTNENVQNAAQKGLIGMFQRMYFHPQHSPQYAAELMANAGASISYGTFRALSRIRFKAAIQHAREAKEFLKEECDYLLVQDQRDEMKRDYSIEFVNRAFSEGKISEGLHGFMGGFFGRHHIYQETLNAAVVAQSVEEGYLESIADEFLRKTYELGGRDCTSIQTVFVHERHYARLIDLVRQKASQLRYGDLMDERVQLAWYDPEDLKNAEGNIRAVVPDKDYEIVKPLSADGIRAKDGVMPSKASTGVAILKLDAATHEIAVDAPNNDLIRYLAEQQELPLMAVIKYSSSEQLNQGMENIRRHFEKAAHYPTHLYVAIYGNTDEIRQLTPLIAPTADLIKINLKFDPYSPHNRRFFLRDVLGLEHIK